MLVKANSKTVTGPNLANRVLASHAPGGWLSGVRMPVRVAGLESALYTKVCRETGRRRKVRASQVRKAAASDSVRGLLMPCRRGQVRVLPLPLGQLFEVTGH